MDDTLPGFDSGKRTTRTEYGVAWTGSPHAGNRVTPADSEQHARTMVDYADRNPHLGAGRVVSRTVTTYTTDWTGA